jgi:hypothetical protein
VPDLLRDHVRLPELARSMPETYELLRLRANEGRIPARKGDNGRVFVERGFALALVEHREHFDSFNTTLQTVSVVSTTDTADDSVSTSVSFLSDEWNIAEHRIRDCASSLSDVALFADKIETTEAGLVSLRRRLSNQFS